MFSFSWLPSAGMMFSPDLVISALTVDCEVPMEYSTLLLIQPYALGDTTIAVGSDFPIASALRPDMTADLHRADLPVSQGALDFASSADINVNFGSIHGVDELTIEMVVEFCRAEYTATEGACEGRILSMDGLNLRYEHNLAWLRYYVAVGNGVTLACKLPGVERAAAAGSGKHYVVFRGSRATGEWRVDVDGQLCDSFTDRPYWIYDPREYNHYLYLGQYPGMALHYFHMSARYKSDDELSVAPGSICE